MSRLQICVKSFNIKKLVLTISNCKKISFKILISCQWTFWHTSMSVLLNLIAFQLFMGNIYLPTVHEAYLFNWEYLKYIMQIFDRRYFWEDICNVSVRLWRIFIGNNLSPRHVSLDIVLMADLMGSFVFWFSIVGYLVGAFACFAWHFDQNSITWLLSIITSLSFVIRTHVFECIYLPL